MSGSAESSNGRSRTLSSETVEETVQTLSNQVRDKLTDESIAFVGIYTRGVTLAKRVAANLSKHGHDIPVGTLDISLYRDDLDLGSTLPKLESSQIPFSLEGTKVILFDDVIFTGRTIRAALDELSDFGRPSKIELAVLVDRGWREIPIQPDYTGYLFETEQNQRVSVMLKEQDGEDGVFLNINEQ